MRVISNTAISLDGRITTVANERFTLGSEADLRLMSQLRNQVDAVLVGGQTFRHWPEPKLPLAKHLAEPMNDGTKWTVLVTRHFAKHVHEDFFSQPNVRMLVFAQSSSVGSIANCEVLLRDEITPQGIVADLAERGIQSLLIEAGGNLIFQFLDANVLNELYVTLCPKIIGGQGAPSLADGRGFLQSQIRNLKLLSHQIIGDEFYLHYEVTLPR